MCFRCGDSHQCRYGAFVKDAVATICLPQTLQHRYGSRKLSGNDFRCSLHRVASLPCGTMVTYPRKRIPIENHMFVRVAISKKRLRFLCYPCNFPPPFRSYRNIYMGLSANNCRRIDCIVKSCPKPSGLALSVNTVLCLPPVRRLFCAISYCRGLADSLEHQCQAVIIIAGGIRAGHEDHQLRCCWRSSLHAAVCARGIAELAVEHCCFSSPVTVELKQLRYRIFLRAEAERRALVDLIEADSCHWTNRCSDVEGGSLQSVQVALPALGISRTCLAEPCVRT